MGLIVPNLQRRKEILNCSALEFDRNGERRGRGEGVETGAPPTSCLEQEERTILDNFLEMLLS